MVQEPRLAQADAVGHVADGPLVVAGLGENLQGRGHDLLPPGRGLRVLASGKSLVWAMTASVDPEMRTKTNLALGRFLVYLRVTEATPDCEWTQREDRPVVAKKIGGGPGRSRDDSGARRLRRRGRQWEQRRRRWQQRHADPGRDRAGQHPVRRGLPLGQRVAVHAGGLRHARAPEPDGRARAVAGHRVVAQRRQDRADAHAAHRREVQRRRAVQRRRRGPEHPALPRRHLAQRVQPGQRQGRQGGGRRHARDHPRRSPTRPCSSTSARTAA